MIISDQCSQPPCAFLCNTSSSSDAQSQCSTFITTCANLQLNFSPDHLCNCPIDGFPWNCTDTQNISVHNYSRSAYFPVQPQPVYVHPLLCFKKYLSQPLASSFPYHLTNSYTNSLTSRNMHVQLPTHNFTNILGCT